MRSALRAAVLLVSFSVFGASAAHAQANPDWHRAISGFRIAGNLYKAYIAEREQAFEKELAKQTVEAHTDAAVSFDLAWDHVALSVPSIPESIAWYEKMLGFKEIRRGGQPSGQQTALIRRGNINIELFQLPNAAPLPESRKNPSEDFRTHGLKHFGFEVKNLPAVLAELKAKGVTMAFEMRDNPTTAFAFISDNAGNAIELIEHKTR
jgi:methylmalonyl-CoA/ethylmalonyl-CoA epimerase